MSAMSGTIREEGPVRVAADGALEINTQDLRRELRRALGRFVTGVTVVTTVDRAGNEWGLTVNSFSSVSLDPPLILWSQSLTAPSHPTFREAGRFAVNILAEHQADISRRFASAGERKFSGVSTRKSLGGVPLIDGCAAYLECKQQGIYPGGDHAIFIGRVERFEIGSANSLIFGFGQYLSAQPLEA
jgi:flavin reductase (DIM6/NTAB) family NADH-FMN oxidoreductase RutF